MADLTPLTRERLLAWKSGYLSVNEPGMPSDEEFAAIIDMALRACDAPEVEALKKQLTIAIDTLIIYASDNRHGPKAAQDCLINLAVDAMQAGRKHD